MPIFRVHRALPLHGTYLWVFVVTLSTHEISNECLILVHLCQADPEGRKVSAVQVAPPLLEGWEPMASSLRAMIYLSTGGTTSFGE